jgi:hypothetical protein
LGSCSSKSAIIPESQVRFLKFVYWG